MTIRKNDEIKGQPPSTRRLAWDPTCLPLGLSFPTKQEDFHFFNSRIHLNLLIEHYLAFKGLRVDCLLWYSWLSSQWSWGLQTRNVNSTYIGNIYVISWSRPMFDHLLESCRRDDSNKWSNLGYGKEMGILEFETYSISGALEAASVCSCNIS